MPVRMLYLFPSTTHPVTNGAQVRANALLRHFISDLGWEVEFFCPTGSRDSSAWGENAALLRAIHIPDPPARGAARLIASLGARPAARPPRRLPAHASCVSSRMRRYAEGRLAAHVARLIRRNAYDAVLTVRLMSLLVERFLGRSRGPLMILDTIDIQYVREGRLGRFREGDCPDLAREKEIELGTIARFDAVFAITPHDEAVLGGSFPGENLRRRDRAASRVRPAWAVVRVVGPGIPRADNEANRLAVRHFCRVLLPMIRKAVPGVTAAIGGRFPSRLRRGATRRAPACAWRGTSPPPPNSSPRGGSSPPRSSRGEG